MFRLGNVLSSGKRLQAKGPVVREALEALVEFRERQISISVMHGGEELRQHGGAFAEGRFPRISQVLHRLTHARNSEFARYAAESSHDDWVGVGVLVGIEVRGLDAGCADFQNLSSQFPFDFFGANDSSRKPRYETTQRIVEIAVFGDQRWDFFQRSSRSSTDEYQVAADSEARIRFCEFDGVIEGWATRHQGGAGKNSIAMGSDNAFIYPAGEAEVVGVED